MSGPLVYIICLYNINGGMVAAKTAAVRKKDGKKRSHAAKPNVTPSRSRTGKHASSESVAQEDTGLALDSSQKRAVLDKLYELVGKTKQNSTICPSQVPRALNQADSKAYPDWRAMMDPVREIVWEEARKGRVQVTQRGEARKYEDRNGLKGPIRVRRGPGWKDEGA